MRIPNFLRHTVPIQKQNRIMRTRVSEASGSYYTAFIMVALWKVTGQLVNTPTRRLPTRGLDKSRTGQLADTDYVDIK